MGKTRPGQLPPITTTITVIPDATGEWGNVIVVTFSSPVIVTAALQISTTIGTPGTQTVLSPTQVTWNASQSQDGATISLNTPGPAAVGYDGAQTQGATATFATVAQLLGVASATKTLTFSIEVKQAGIGSETSITDTTHSSHPFWTASTGPAFTIAASSWNLVAAGDTITFGGQCSRITDSNGNLITLPAGSLTAT